MLPIYFYVSSSLRSKDVKGWYPNVLDTIPTSMCILRRIDPHVSLYFITSTASDSGLFIIASITFFMVHWPGGIHREKLFQLNPKNLRNIMVWIVHFGSSTSCILGLYQWR